MDISTAQSTGLSRIKPTLEFLGSTTILVVLMGLPATLHQYSTLHVPIALLSYRRVFEAGLFPATLLVLFLIYLFWTERKLSGCEESVFAGIADSLSRRNTAKPNQDFTQLPFIPFIFLLILVCLTAYLAIYTWGLWGIGWVFIKPIEWVFDGFILSDRWMIVLGCSIIFLCFLIIKKFFDKLGSSVGIALFIPIVFVILFFVIEALTWGLWGIGWVFIKPIEWVFDGFILSDRWTIILGFSIILVVFLYLLYKMRKEKSSLDLPTNLIKRPAGYTNFIMNSKTLKGSIIRSLFAYILGPVLVILYVYLTKSGILLIGLPWPVSFTQEALLQGGIFIGIASAHFMSVVFLGKFTTSRNKRTSEIAKNAIRVTYSIFVIACITLYSFYIYPHLPRSYGGGHPETLDIVTSGSVMPDYLGSSFKINKAGNIYIENIQLIDKTINEVIFCKVQQTTHRCFALPNSSIVGMTWKNGGNN